MKKIYILFLFISLFNNGFAQPTLVYEDFSEARYFDYGYFSTFDNHLVYSLFSDMKRSFWMTDGTTSTNITQGIDSLHYHRPVVIGNEMYFFEKNHLNDVRNGKLWKTDGTTNGLEMVWDSILPYWMFDYQNKLFLNIKSNDNADSFSELWIIDGTIKTKLLDSLSYLKGTVEYNNFLYFYTDSHGLMKTDGTVAGTSLVKMSNNSNFMNVHLNTAIYNGELYFSVYDMFDKWTIWKTDGTEIGTKSIHEASATPVFEFNYNVQLDVVNNQLYAYERKGIFSISNGVVTPLLEFADLHREGRVKSARSINNKLVFIINTHNKNGSELWVTDEQTNNIKLLKEINRSAADGVESFSFLAEMNGYLYFQGNDGVFGRELWRTDGTADNTEMVYDFAPNGQSIIIEYAQAVDSTLYFITKPYSPKGYSQTPSLWRFDLSNFTPQQPVDYRPDDEWFSSIYSDKENRLVGFKMDNNDNVYIAIQDNNTSVDDIVFYEQDTILHKPKSDENSVTIAKLSNENEFLLGTVIQTDLGGSYHDYQIVPDNNNNFYVAGFFYSNLTIADTTIVKNPGSSYLFIAKLDANGMLDWIKISHCYNESKVNDLLITSTNEIYIVGYLGYLDFDGNIFEGEDQPFILKLDNNGDLQWLHLLDEKVTDISNIYAAIDANDNIVIAAAKYQLYFYKVNALGTTLWKRIFPVNHLTYIKDLEINSLNDIFMVGFYHNQLHFDDLNANYTGEDFNGFITQFNSLGEPIKLYTDEVTSSRYYSITFDADNNFYLSDNTILPAPFVYQNWESFSTWTMTSIKHVNLEGNVLKERKLINQKGSTNDFAVVEVDSKENIYFASMYQVQLDTFANSITQRGTYDHTIQPVDIPFVLYFDGNTKMETAHYFLPSITAEKQDSSRFVIYPNPMTTSCNIYNNDENWENYRLNIYNSSGQILKSIPKNDLNDNFTVNVSDLYTGIYIFEFDNGIEKITTKVVKH